MTYSPQDNLGPSCPRALNLRHPIVKNALGCYMMRWRAPIDLVAMKFGVRSNPPVWAVGPYGDASVVNGSDGDAWKWPTPNWGGLSAAGMLAVFRVDSISLGNVPIIYFDSIGMQFSNANGAFQFTTCTTGGITTCSPSSFTFSVGGWYSVLAQVSSPGDHWDIWINGHKASLPDPGDMAGTFNVPSNNIWISTNGFQGAHAIVMPFAGFYPDDLCKELCALPMLVLEPDSERKVFYVPVSATLNMAIASAIPVPTFSMGITATGGMAMASAIPIPAMSMGITSPEVVTVASAIPIPTFSMTIIENEGIQITSAIPIPVVSMSLTASEVVSIASAIPVPVMSMGLTALDTVAISSAIPIPAFSMAITEYIIPSGSVMSTAANPTTQTLDPLRTVKVPARASRVITVPARPSRVIAVSAR